MFTRSLSQNCPSVKPLKPDFTQVKRKIALEIASRLLLLESAEEVEQVISQIDPEHKALQGKMIFPDEECQAILKAAEEGHFPLDLSKVLPPERVRVWERRLDQVVTVESLPQHVADWKRVEEAERRYLEGLTAEDEALEALKEIDQQAFYTLPEEERTSEGAEKEGPEILLHKKTFATSIWRTFDYIEGIGTFIGVARGRRAIFIQESGKAAEAIRQGDLFIRPPYGVEAQKRLVLYPSDVEEFTSVKALYESLIKFYRRYYEAGREEDYQVMACYAMTSWFAPRLPALPILALEGPSSKGKSRGSEVVWLTCSYPYRSSGTKFASWVRTVDHYFTSTLLINEADFDRRNPETEELVKFYNVRPVRSEAVIQRMTEGGQKVYSFNVFGPTIATLRQPFDDDAVERRTLKLRPKALTQQDIPFNLPPEAYREAERLRNMLAGLALEYLGKYQHRYLTLRDIGGRLIEPRLVQLTEGMINVAEMLGVKEEIFKALERATQIQKESIALTRDALIFRAYFQLLRESDEITREDILRRGVKPGELEEVITELGGRISMQAISKRMLALGFIRYCERHYLLPKELHRERAVDYLPMDELVEISSLLQKMGLWE